VQSQPKLETVKGIKGILKDTVVKHHSSIIHQRELAPSEHNLRSI